MHFWIINNFSGKWNEYEDEERNTRGEGGGREQENGVLNGKRCSALNVIEEMKCNNLFRVGIFTIRHHLHHIKVYNSMYQCSNVIRLRVESRTSNSVLHEPGSTTYFSMLFSFLFSNKILSNNLQPAYRISITIRSVAAVARFMIQIPFSHLFFGLAAVGVGVFGCWFR